MTKEDSISKVDSLIYRLKNLIDDLEDCKKDFIDLEEEYFLDEIKASNEIEILGFFNQHKDPAYETPKSVGILLWKRHDVFTKVFHVDEDFLKNIKRKKLIEKML